MDSRTTTTGKLKPAGLLKTEPVPVSFTVRRPTPLSLSRDTSTGPDESDSSASASAGSFKVVPLPQRLRGSEREEEARARRRGSPLARGVATAAGISGSGGIDVPSVDSSDDDDDEGDEPVTAFDRLSGALNESSTGNGAGKKRRRSELEGGAPLVIPALKNRDWRELARRRRGVGYVPGQGSNTNRVVGQDSINTGPVLVGLQVKARTKIAVEERNGGGGSGSDVEMVAKVVEETEDEKALRLVLAESSKGEFGDDGPMIDSIPMQERQTITEADALKQDVEELPDSASLEDYSRVPVAQFGAALLRGMGWKAKKDSELYLPEARPALLGIGAKEQEVYDDGSEKKKRRDLNPKGPYLPVKQVVREERARGSRSRRGSRSPDRYSSSRRDRDRRA